MQPTSENRTDRPRRPDQPGKGMKTVKQQVRIRTKHGTLRIGPNGQLHGLWRIVRAELRTNEEVRALCGIKTRKTLIEWRRDRQFPKPVMEIPAKGGTVELWERTAVEAWLEARRTRTESPTALP